MPRPTLKVGLAGLGAVGLGVARRLETGIPGLVLAAIAVRDKDKARRNLPDAGGRIPIMPAEALAQSCDIVVECLPPDMFRKVATSVDRSRQNLHAAFGRPASGKLGFGGAGEADRRAHPGSDRRASWPRRGARRRRRHHPFGDDGHAQAAERARRRALSGRARHFARRISKSRRKSSTAARARARAAFPPTSTSPRRSASPVSARTRRGSKSGPIRRSRATRTASRSTPTPRDFP